MAGRAGRLTIRFRLGLALALALAPVLALGLLQVVSEFHRDGEVRQAALIQAASRSAATAKAKTQAALALLETLKPAAVGAECTPRLANVLGELEGYHNLVRLDVDARVQCAAASVPQRSDRASLAWFQQLKGGAASAIGRSRTASDPTFIVASRAERRDGSFDGALVASLELSSLQPDTRDPALPPGSAVGVAAADGRYLVVSDRKGFAPLSPQRVTELARTGGVLSASGPDGVRRDFAAAPLIAGQGYVVLSAPSPSLLYWVRLNPFSAVVYPILAWLAAWAAVWVVADRVVIRWLAYLDRIASIYARGRFTVRPVKAERAPAEIRALAHTLNAMADAIVARDLTLRDNLAQKDALMREIHHRVKNNLQIITSLINMQQRALADPAARAAMSDTRQRISALALIYRALYQGPDLRRVEVRQFLEELVGQIGVGEGVRSATPIRIELHADNLEIDPDKLAPLALFAVEAITNARKHAFSEQGGLITVTFRVGEDEVVLEVGDDGGGSVDSLPSAGVGRTLMSAFARQLGGHTEVEPAPGGGILVMLSFPRPPPIAVIEDGAAGNQVAA